MADGKVLEFSGVTKVFGDVSAVSDLTARVEPGVVTAVLGPNGAGKTTSLRILLGEVRPSSGTATIGGSTYSGLSRPARTVGAVLETPTFRPRRTATRQLTSVAKANGIPQTRVREVLDLVGLSDVADMRIGSYSLGMRQRLSIAQALLGDPGVLVFDEPVNGMDPEGIRWMRLLMRRLADEGRTVLMSSHLLSEVQQIADRILIISNGKLVFSGDIEDLADVDPIVIVDSTDRQTLTKALREKGYEFEVLRSGINVRDARAKALGEVAAEAGVALSVLHQRGASLEDVFLDLVNGRPTRQTAALPQEGAAAAPAEETTADADAPEEETTAAVDGAPLQGQDAPAGPVPTTRRAAAAAGAAGAAAAGIAASGTDEGAAQDADAPQGDDAGEAQDGGADEAPAPAGDAERDAGADAGRDDEAEPPAEGEDGAEVEADAAPAGIDTGADDAPAEDEAAAQGAEAPGDDADDAAGDDLPQDDDVAGEAAAEEGAAGAEPDAQDGAEADTTDEGPEADATEADASEEDVTGDAEDDGAAAEDEAEHGASEDEAMGEAAGAEFAQGDEHGEDEEQGEKAPAPGEDEAARDGESEETQTEEPRRPLPGSDALAGLLSGDEDATRAIPTFPLLGVTEREGAPGEAAESDGTETSAWSAGPSFAERVGSAAHGEDGAAGPEEGDGAEHAEQQPTSDAGEPAEDTAPDDAPDAQDEHGAAEGGPAEPEATTQEMSFDEFTAAFGDESGEDGEPEGVR